MIKVNIDMPLKCFDCPFFIPSDSPKDFTVKCKILGNLGSPLNLIDTKPIDCPLSEVTE